MQAKKSLGQHFLKSEKALTQIIEAGSIHPSDTILEIGPGTGVLTSRLLEKAKTVVALEKDRALMGYLSDTFHDALDSKKLILLERDVLTFDPLQMQFYGKAYKLIANIPYYITGAIIEQFLSARLQPSQMVLLIQKEVAERIVAKGGKESVLSIAVKAYGTPKIIDKVPKGAFAPAPKVDSAIISIDHISRVFFEGLDETLFFSLLKSLFGKKRKQIGGSLAEYLGDKPLALSLLAHAKISPQTRPENLALADWKRLATLVHTHTKRVQ